MYNRYGDITKFITEPDKLVYDGVLFVTLSEMDDYDIMFDLNSSFGSFDEQKEFIALVARHICEMDNTVQRFFNSRCFQDGLSPLTRTIYPEHLKIITDLQETECDYHLSHICRTKLLNRRIEDYVVIAFDYYVPKSNSQFDVFFEYVDGKFYLRRILNIFGIPDDWEENITTEK